MIGILSQYYGLWNLVMLSWETQQAQMLVVSGLEYTVEIIQPDRTVWYV